MEIDYAAEEAAIDVTDMSFDDELVDVGAEQDLDEELSMERELFAIAHEQNARAEARFAAAAMEPGAEDVGADEPDEPDGDEPATDEPAADGSGSGAETDE